MIGFLSIVTNAQDALFLSLEKNRDAELLFETKVQITGGETFGVNPQEIFTKKGLIPPTGIRMNGDYKGIVTGSIEGEYSGTDYSRTLQYGLVEINARGVIKTNDGATISVHSTGEVPPAEDNQAPLYEITKLVTNHSKYKYLNDTYILSKGIYDRAKNEITIQHYGFKNDPLITKTAPYVITNHVDYVNFPIDVKNLDKDPRATLVYEVNGGILGMESFGIDPAKVFGGQVTIPKEGIRMDVPFAGETSKGTIKGKINGIDYITALPNRNTKIDVHGTITTKTGEKIDVKVDGLLIPNSQTKGNYFETLKLTSNSEKYKYLNDKYFIGYGESDFTTQKLKIRIYQFDKNPLTVEPKVVLITGTADGMGKTHAERLIKEGHIVYGGDIQYEKNKYLDKIGGHVLKMDVTKDDEVEAAVDQIIKKHGKIDVLINNAGYGVFATVEEMTMEDAIAMVNVNLIGVGRVTKAVLPHMRKQQSGKIINISSMGGKMYFGLGSWYHSTKHALEGWSDCLRVDVKKFGIDVVIVEPGIINTNFYNVNATKGAKYTQNTNYGHMYKLMEGGIAAMSEPEEISEVINEIVENPEPETRYIRGFLAKPLVNTRQMIGDKAFDQLLLSNFGQNN